MGTKTLEAMNEIVDDHERRINTLENWRTGKDTQNGVSLTQMALLQKSLNDHLEFHEKQERRAEQERRDMKKMRGQLFAALIGVITELVVTAVALFAR